MHACINRPFWLKFDNVQYQNHYQYIYPKESTMQNFTSKFVSYSLIISTLCMSIWVPVAQASIITADQVINSQVATQNRERVLAFFDREDVQTQLQAQGVSAVAAKDRVASLTDSEVASMAGHIDSLPAGGTDILGFFLIVFLVLLFTDILGLTHVYPFTRRH
jgi:hypothetical protein